MASSPPPSFSGPSKKRTSDVSSASASAPPNKRRKASSTHPLRQTSFPPEPASPFIRSPSVDTMSHVSGSQVSAVTGKKKRGRKAKNPKDKNHPAPDAATAAAAAAAAREATPSLVGGRAPTSVSFGGTAGGDKEAGIGDDEDDADGPVNVEDAAAATDEQRLEELRLRGMLVEAFDDEQYRRYEVWRASKLSDAVVKRVVNATVSQSVPQNVVLAVKSVSKLFIGQVIEIARQVQAEAIASGQQQSELPLPPDPTAVSNNNNSNTPKKRDLRGPLLPEHLREAWRRYKMANEGAGVGLQSLWHAQQKSGNERFATRTGRKMFR